jgi:3-oxoacyl-[acyl-carrier-protein] synthase II
MCVASTRLAWTDADFRPASDELEEIGLMFATGAGAMRESVEFERTARLGPDAASPNLFPHTAGNAAAGHVCQVLGIHGPMLSISQGGVSSLVALHYAAELIRDGAADVMIVLGADETSAASVMLADRQGVTLRSERCVRPFDQSADGAAFGTNAVSIVLESEAHARARGATPYGEVLGAAFVGCLDAFDDPATKDAWSEAMWLAPDRSECGADEVGYCAAAAAGVPSLDMAELAALDETFGSALAVTAPKASTGEGFGASGVVNVLVAALAMRDGVLMPTANLVTPAPSAVQLLMGEAQHRAVEYCIANAASPGATYGCVVLGRVSE